MAPPMVPGRALAAIAGLARLVSCIGPEFTEPIPSRQECPHCGFAEWSCKSPCSPLLGIEYNFSHETYSCFEAIPANDKTLFWDTDAYCLFPEAHEFINCDNMDDYRLDNPYVLKMDKCTLSSSSTITVGEECHWTCKAGRPYYRCKWTFDPEGKFDHSGTSLLQKCWLKESCTAGNRQKVEAACRPLDIWTQAGLNEQEKSVLQEQLMHLGDHHTMAAKELIQALTSAGLSQEAAAAAWGKYNSTVEGLSSNSNAMKALADDGAYEGQTVLTTVLVQGVDYVLILENGKADSALEGAVKKVVSDAAGVGYSKDDVKVAFRRSSLLIEASLSTPGAVTAAMVQLKLQGTTTLGQDILEALEEVPAFKTSIVGPVSVGSVGVEVLQRQPEGQSLDLALEVEKYRMQLAAERSKSKSSEEKVGALTIAVVTLSAVAFLLLLVIAFLFVARKRTSKVLPPTETDHIVIGRPVNPDQEAGRAGNVDGKPPNNDAGGGVGGLLSGPTAGAIITAVPMRQPEKPTSGTPAPSGPGVKGLEL